MIGDINYLLIANGIDLVFRSDILSKNEYGEYNFNKIDRFTIFIYSTRCCYNFFFRKTLKITIN